MTPNQHSDLPDRAAEPAASGAARHVASAQEAGVGDKPALRRWITEMRVRDEWPETDIRLMDAIESLLEDHDSLEEQLHAVEVGYKARGEIIEKLEAEATSLFEQLEAYRRALEEIAKTEWFDGEDRFAGPDDIARMALAVSEVRHVGDGPEHLRYIEGWELNPASSPTYHVPEEHGRFPAAGMTAPVPATQRGHTEYRSNLLGETTAGASSSASEPDA